MKLCEFIDKYDFPHSVVLLEGKRTVLQDDKDKLIALGILLAKKTTNVLFRRGNAGGADQLFGSGVIAVNPKRFHVIVPYTGHRELTKNDFETVSIENIDFAKEPEVIKFSKLNRKTEKLIDNFVSGEINKVTIKAAYIIRDTVKVLNTRDINPTSFGIFYDDLLNLRQGGIGQIMNVCEKMGIPMIIKESG